jgi:hypothetical protein
MRAIRLDRTVTVNAGQRQAIYVTMSLSSDTAYLRYGQNYTGDSANTTVAQDSNLIVYAGSGIRWQFPPVSPRFFVGRVIYFIEP